MFHAGSLFLVWGVISKSIRPPLGRWERVGRGAAARGPWGPVSGPRLAHLCTWAPLQAMPVPGPTCSCPANTAPGRERPHVFAQLTHRLEK